MSSGQAKKLYIMYILEILKKYSDDRHRLKQQDIIDIMKKDYDVACERKAVARNISDLQELGYDIISTGHYAKTDGKNIFRAQNHAKDQSYVMYNIQKDMIPHIRFPLADMSKDEIREIARKAGGAPFIQLNSLAITRFEKSSSFFTSTISFFSASILPTKSGAGRERPSPFLCPTV